MKDAGGRGQGPGRGSSGAGSQGGPGAARRTPQGPRRPKQDPFDVPWLRQDPEEPGPRKRPGADEGDGPGKKPGPDARPSRTDNPSGQRSRTDNQGDQRGRTGNPSQRSRTDGQSGERGRTDGSAGQRGRTDSGQRGRSTGESGVPRPRGGSPRRDAATQPPFRAPRPGGGRRPPPRPPRPPLILRLGNPRRRINIGMIGMTFILSIFAGRLIQMQGLDSKVYEAAAADQRVRTEEIPAERGAITDVNGHPLAATVAAREIAVDPTKVPAGRRAAVTTALAKALGKPEAEIAAKLAKVNSRYQLLARDVDPLAADALLKQELPAVTAKKQYRRIYPAGDLAGSLIGFVGDDGTGLGGIEQVKNAVLAGQDGEQRVEIGRDGQRIPMTRNQRKAPIEGRDVRLTIDRDIQWAAQKAIAEQVKATGSASGAVIVMDVRTGQIVAMANAPELDLNNWRKSPQERYINRAAADVFEPGSTNKVITAAAALEAGVVRPESVFRVPYSIMCADERLKDAHQHPTENMTFQMAVAKSSNVATILAARRVGDQRLHQMMKAFGFGARPGGGVPGEGAGLLPDYKSWSGSQRCTVAYGQGVSVTALQMASVYQTIANGGVRIEPQIIAGTTDLTGRFVAAKAPKQVRVVSDSTAKEITTMLESAVSVDGTGNLASIPGYRVAGKTGTADRYDQELGRYNGYTASFVGFSPADAPRLVVLSVLQNPTKGHFGGQIAAPVFKDVMTFAIKSKKIPPTGSTAPPVRIRAGE